MVSSATEWRRRNWLSTCLLYTSHLKKGGYFITSGIINLKEEAVRAAFAASEELEVVEITYQGEWLSVTARKK